MGITTPNFNIEQRRREIVFEKGKNILGLQDKDKLWMFAAIKIIQEEEEYKKADDIEKTHIINKALQELNNNSDIFFYDLQKSNPYAYTRLMLLKNISLN